ncbi:MAG TPA: hypothetical protein VJG49_01605 [Candidatus Nanoarchaeia archaeon]|nr:hypothetical protein [Candidatus Nanoarchaeia archaeon]
MKPFWEKVEHYNAKLIPYALILLFGVIIFELFIHIENHIVELAVEIVDYLVIVVFAVDLVFLAIHAQSVKFFFKNYWLDIIAVIPVALIFKLVNIFYDIFTAVERIAIGQAVLHETLEVKTEVAVLSRSERAAKYLKVFTRGIRVITKSRFFTELKRRHHHTKTHPKKRRKRKKGKRIPR